MEMEFTSPYLLGQPGLALVIAAAANIANMITPDTMIICKSLPLKPLAGHNFFMEVVLCLDMCFDCDTDSSPLKAYGTKTKLRIKDVISKIYTCYTNATFVFLIIACSACDHAHCPYKLRFWRVK
jgi:hypothetical protein